MKTDEEKVSVYNYWRSEYSELLDRTSDRIKEIQSLKQQLADAEKVIDEVISRSVYTYSNTQCKSAKERVIKIAKLCERYKSKYKVGKK